VVFDIEHHVQSDYVHLAEGTSLTSREQLLDFVHILRCRDAFSDDPVGLAFDSSPDGVENELRIGNSTYTNALSPVARR
jgi:hypothetical protein